MGLNIVEILKLGAQFALDEKVAELQLHSLSAGDEATVELPEKGMFEWADNTGHYKVKAFVVEKVK